MGLDKPAARANDVAAAKGHFGWNLLDLAFRAEPRSKSESNKRQRNKKLDSTTAVGAG